MFLDDGVGFPRKVMGSYIELDRDSLSRSMDGSLCSSIVCVESEVAFCLSATGFFGRGLDGGFRMRFIVAGH